MKQPLSSRLLWLTLLIMLSFTSVASAQGNSITDLVADTEQFSTLQGLLEAADLEDTLADTGEAYTVFAPTNEAFAKIPAADLEALQEDPAQLRNVLLYHVVRGRTSSSGVAALTAVPTLQGNNIRVSLNDETVILDGRAQVVEADLTASNGVIHVIDTVLFPTEAATATVVLPDSGAANNSLPTLIGLGIGALFILLGGVFALRKR